MHIRVSPVHIYTDKNVVVRVVCGEEQSVSSGFGRFHDERPKDHFFQYLGNIFHSHCLLQILIPVDIRIELKPHQREPEVIERLVIEVHSFPVEGLKQIGKYKRVLKSGNNARVNRERFFLQSFTLLSFLVYLEP